MRNGERARQRRSGIETVAPTANPEEAAAISAALEHFLAETAPAPRAEARQSGWQRAALREGIEARSVGSDLWGGAPR